MQQLASLKMCDLKVTILLRYDVIAKNGKRVLFKSKLLKYLVQRE